MTLDDLLNILLQRGWKPFGIACTDFIKGTGLEGIPSYCFNPHPHMGFPGGTRKYHRPSLRQIVSKESGLWQFVCKNGMVKNIDDYSWELYDGTHGQCDVYKNGYEGGTRWEQVDYEYRLIEASLKDESELEDFLLSNIKVDE